LRRSPWGVLARRITVHVEAQAGTANATHSVHTLAMVTTADRRTSDMRPASPLVGIIIAEFPDQFQNRALAAEERSCLTRYVACEIYNDIRTTLTNTAPTRIAV
jgi:hypothetical protein